MVLPSVLVASFGERNHDGGTFHRGAANFRYAGG
jgi:hypothetical protein